MQTFEQLEVYKRRGDAAFYWGGLLLLLALALLLTGTAWAQEPGAAAASLDDPSKYFAIIADAVQHRAWGTVAAAVLVLLVALLRAFGKRLHEFIPDESPFDKPLFFLYDTKPGGWLLNTLTSLAGGFGVALLANQPVTLELAGTVATVSFTAAGIWGLVKDLLDWWSKRKPSEAPAQAAGLEASKKPGSGVDA